VNNGDLDRIFDSHPPANDEEALAHEQVRQAFKDVAKTMSNLPAGRERAIVLTKLEEASFFAHAAIGRGPA
jgi:DNA-directed RNA polymerase specialized sigma24 family protein